MTLAEAYPDVLLPATRANIKKIIDSGSLNYIAYTFKKFGQPTEDEIIAMKDVVEWEFRKHFIGLGTNKGAFQAIKTALPNVDMSSDICRDLRKHLIQRFGDWKFDLVSNSIYVSQYNICIIYDTNQI